VKFGNVVRFAAGSSKLDFEGGSSKLGVLQSALFVHIFFFRNYTRNCWRHPNNVLVIFMAVNIATVEFSNVC